MGMLQSAASSRVRFKSTAMGNGQTKLRPRPHKTSPGSRLADKVLEESARLDKYYTAPRYADMWSEGSPHEYYTKSEANEAIKYAQKIIIHVEKEWRKLKSYKGESKKKTEE